jgi:hypothetical protein
MNKLFFLFITQIVFANGETAVDAGRFGPGKAVESFDKEQGFKMSDKALSSLGVKFSKLDGQGPWFVPKSAIVHMKQSAGVYRRYDGWISLVLVKIERQQNDLVAIRSEDLEESDEVSIRGSAFLRMTDADLNAGTVDSCAH